MRHLPATTSGVTMELSDHLLMLERQLQQAEVRADRQALEALLADDFLEFGASGGRWDKAQVLASLPQQVFIERRISEFAVQCLGADLAQVTYLCHNAAAPGRAASSAWRSSLWRCQEGRWQMLFHQGTPRPNA
ncbi:nuclear transport factor 2 family protein [Pseudomonas protegens]|uniref:nuclear transport factor 2 family protein n=1 Tax=Pseudomonas protegens TaxID=380021 RepID=UPI0021C72D66|nr:nuclear transport factor 2 family protein [Pseudomonas protegens]MCU1769601.1 nuclear transport factor 2 family protein [Pseudomonas protegens]